MLQIILHLQTRLLLLQTRRLLDFIKSFYIFCDFLINFAACRMLLAASSSCSGTGSGAHIESEEEVIVWHPYHWSIGKKVAAYFEAGRGTRKRKRMKLFVGEVVKYAKPSQPCKRDELYHIMWEDNDNEDYDCNDLKTGVGLFNEMVKLGRLPPQMSPRTKSDSAPYCVLVEGLDYLPLSFLNRSKDKSNSIDFNSKNDVEFKGLCHYLIRQLFRVSIKLTLVADETCFELPLEAPLAKTANGPFRVLIGGIASITAGFEPNSWRFRKHLIVQMDVYACTVRLLADGSDVLLPATTGASSASTSSASASAMSLLPAAAEASSASTSSASASAMSLLPATTGATSASTMSSASASAVTLLLDDICVLVEFVRKHL